MGQRRKYVTQTLVTEDVQPPDDNQHIVKCLGTRGGNIVEVEYPDGATTLCLMPAKFNRKLWVRRGGFLMIESSPEAEQDSGSRVTGTITAVLYDEHIKQLKKLPGVWPAEFASTQHSAAAAAAAAAGGDSDLPPGSSSSSGSEDEGDVDAGQLEGASGRQLPASSSQGAAAAGTGPGSQQTAAAAAAAAAGDGGGGNAGAAAEDEGSESEDDGLPPLQQNNNRRIITHYLSDSDSDSEGE